MGSTRILSSSWSVVFFFRAWLPKFPGTVPICNGPPPPLPVVAPSDPELPRMVPSSSDFFLCQQQKVHPY